MRNLICLFLVGILISLSSCRKDFETVPSSGNLGFSKDTVYLDTVFSHISSSTYTLKVYNRSNDDIKIPSIHLQNPDSKYRLMVDGLTGEDGTDIDNLPDGRVFKNVELLAKDSLYIFIETTANTADANPTDFLYTDDIVFESSNGPQKVNLVTLIRDAYFLFPKKDANGIKENLLLGTDTNGDEVRINGFELDENDPNNGDEYHFNNTKPYVIYGYAGVPDGKTLTIDPGAKVYFHAESGIVVQPGASIDIRGGVSPDPTNPQQNEVTFEGDRLEPLYEDIPGQWGTIWLRSGSINNKIDHLTLKNATLGLLVENCSLKLQNSQIYNSANYGILARGATMNDCENLVINLAGQASLACSLGGSYQFKHCTFNNNWASSNQVAVLVSNYEEYANGDISSGNLTQANFLNCIIYGNNNVELFLDKLKSPVPPSTTIPDFNFLFDHCLVKFRDAGTSLAGKEEYISIRTPLNDNIKNKDPLFFNANMNKLNISDDATGGAYQKGSIDYIIATDVLGHTRTSNPPDLGAYQSAAFPE